MSDDEVRHLRFKLKRANKTMGAQGETIYRLRGELALVREEHSKIERGDLRSLERRVEHLVEDLVAAQEEVKKLRNEKRDEDREET
jgi:hypothetical protein